MGADGLLITFSNMPAVEKMCDGWMLVPEILSYPRVPVRHQGGDCYAPFLKSP